MNMSIEDKFKILNAVALLCFLGIILCVAYYTQKYFANKEFTQEYFVIQAQKERIQELELYIEKQKKLIKFERLLFIMMGEEGKDNMLALEGCMDAIGIEVQ